MTGERITRLNCNISLQVECVYILILFLYIYPPPRVVENGASRLPRTPLQEFRRNTDHRSHPQYNSSQNYHLVSGLSCASYTDHTLFNAFDHYVLHFFEEASGLGVSAISPIVTQKRKPTMERYVARCDDLKTTLMVYTESNLATHDIALPLSGQGPGVEAKKALLLLLSASDLVAEEATMKRIERLALLNGGDNVSIIFLLRERKDSRECMNEFMDLQSR